MYVPKLTQTAVNVIFIINASTKFFEKQILSLHEKQFLEMTLGSSL